jgi:hypothetical protein
MMRASGKGAFHVAPLDKGAPTRSRTDTIPFNLWWDGMFVIKDKEGNTFMRKDLILEVAETDGGVHIDPSLKESYVKLSRLNSINWHYYNGEEKEFENNPVLASVRQIAHEVIKTLKGEFPDLK